VIEPILKHQSSNISDVYDFDEPVDDIKMSEVMKTSQEFEYEV